MRDIDLITVLGDSFYFARHGETDYNIRGLVTGSRDIALNDRGLEQAMQSAGVISLIGAASCICSPLDRAATTARLMTALTDLEPVMVPDLTERCWGKLEGVSKKDLDKYSFHNHNVELWEDFTIRTVKSLAGVDVRRPVLIVAHSGTFRVLCEYLKINIRKQPVRNAWPYRFYHDGVVWYVEMVSEKI